ncbi:hypothetical protein V5H98_11815 [Georgenia sp. M64]|uniref:hypothetical protein n=1 Tax=Georgenia sp. M64 TaxID=3120520 RepID=UPI0030E48AC1
MLIAVEAALVIGGRIDLGTAVAALVAVEVILGAAILALAWRAARTHDGDRVAAAARALLPGPVAAVILLELGQIRALWLLVRRRIHTEHREDTTISYAAGRGSVYLMVVAVCLIELFAVHLIVPWQRLGTWSWLQWLALTLSAYAVVWILAWWAAQRTHPHLITDEELILRNGTLVALRVPLEQIQAARPRRRGQVTDERLNLGGPGGGTNIDIDLDEPVTWRSFTGRRERQISAIALEVDDPATSAQEIITAIRSRRPH